MNWDKQSKDYSSGILLQYDPVSGDEYTPSGMVTIKVTDTGPGLSPEQLENMFQEGVQFNPNELQRGQGSGLGLWISREIIQQHGGTITVTSEGLGKGSTFIVSIPVLLPTVTKSSRFSTSSRVTASHEIQGPHSLQLPIRVLVVDDSKLNAKMLSRLLQTAGMRVTMVYSGQECITVMSDPQLIEQPFDLIVMDFIMPEMSGPDTSRALRASGHKLPIIGVTGNVLPDDIQCFMAAGANAVFPKPIILSTFLEACKDLVLNSSQDSESSTRISSEVA